jgi:mannitol/fructose-specific phosphotransferase system IIA component (Ntr-type)
MQIVDFIHPESINLNLSSKTKSDVLVELVDTLPLDTKSRSMVVKMLKKRENIGSTGIGKNLAIPHGRSLVVNRLMISVGISKDGIDFDAIDGNPVHIFFLIVAPPLEISNLYHPTLSKLVQILRNARNRKEILNCTKPEELIKKLEVLDAS